MTFGRASPSQLQPVPGAVTWELWRAVQVDHARVRLVWPHGYAYALRDLLACGRSSRLALVRVLPLGSPAALYRPLQPCGVHDASRGGALQQQVCRWYGIGAGVLTAIGRRYPAPAALLARRLLDLALALQE